MPIKPGEYAQALRSLGQVLEKEQAEDITITFEEDSMSGSWRGRNASGDPQVERQLHVLHEQARMVRVKVGQLAREGLAEILRSLGQDLDEQGIEVLSIVQKDDRWVVTSPSPEGPVEREYLTENLLEKSRLYRELRREQRATSLESPDAPMGGLRGRAGPIGRRILRRDVSNET